MTVRLIRVVAPPLPIRRRHRINEELAWVFVVTISVAAGVLLLTAFTMVAHG